MGDLVERLRTVKMLSQRNQMALQAEAADEIARLREEVKKLREPTPAMIAAGQAACEWLKDEEAATVYRAMIAAADDGGR